MKRTLEIISGRRWLISTDSHRLFVQKLTSVELGIHRQIGSQAGADFTEVLQVLHVIRSLPQICDVHGHA